MSVVFASVRCPQRYVNWGVTQRVEMTSANRSGQKWRDWAPSSQSRETWSVWSKGTPPTMSLRDLNCSPVQETTSPTNTGTVKGGYIQILTAGGHKPCVCCLLQVRCVCEHNAAAWGGKGDRHPGTTGSETSGGGPQCGAAAVVSRQKDHWCSAGGHEATLQYRSQEHHWDYIMLYSRNIKMFLLRPPIFIEICIMYHTCVSRRNETPRTWLA